MSRSYQASIRLLDSDTGEVILSVSSCEDLEKITDLELLAGLGVFLAHCLDEHIAPRLAGEEDTDVSPDTSNYN